MRKLSRRWIAWKLVSLAAQIKFPEYEQTITIQPPDGLPIEIHVIGDLYGCGIASTTGIPWKFTDDDGAPVMEGETRGWRFRWEDSE